MPYIFVVMDELYDYTSLLPKKSKKDSEGKSVNPNNQEDVFSLFGNLMSKSRAVGIHIVFGTQKPTSDIIPTAVSTHCSVRIGLRCSKSQESINIIEETGLEKIKPSDVGRGIIKDGNLTEFQSFYLTDKNLESICSQYRIQSSRNNNYQKELRIQSIEKESIESEVVQSLAEEIF